MPHIQIACDRLPQMPLESEGATFRYVARNLRHPDEYLIMTEAEGVRFLLLLRQREDNWLIKAEKVTRPSPVHPLKLALDRLAQSMQAKVLYSNTHNHGRDMLKRPSPFLKPAVWFADPGAWSKPAALEIGFGSGRHLLFQAKRSPQTRFVGLEIHKPSLEQVMRQIALQDLQNIDLVDDDARLFLELLPSDTLQAIYLHFPVPWDKKPHRRIISLQFVHEALRVLEPGGYLELRTDSETYFANALDLFSALPRLSLEVEKNLDGEISSKYEDRWRRLEKNIYQMRLHCRESGPAKTDIADFSFPSPMPWEVILERLPGDAIVRERCFVHFEKFFASHDGRGLIRVSLGDFDRPEHKYVIINETGASYFPEPPMRTRANAMAHQIISEYLSCQK